MIRRRFDNSAEVGASAMIVFIAILLASSVIAALIISVGEIVFVRTGEDAQVSSHGNKGIINIVVLEIFALGATDELHIVFDLPFIEKALPEEELIWILMCEGVSGTGSNILYFDTGHFGFATTLDGDGLTSLPLVEFQPGDIYRMRIQLDECDLENLVSSKKVNLLIDIKGGSSSERVLRIGDSPYVGKDLI